MIDIVDFFEQQIELWNEERKCGYCWDFEYVERISDLNESEQQEDECCLKVFLTDLTLTKNRNYANNQFYITSKSVTQRFNLYFLINDRIDINVYQEQKRHPIEESKWKKILKPIMDCISDLDFCVITGLPIRYDSENWSVVLDFQDQNYSGWRVQFSLTETIEIE